MRLTFFQQFAEKPPGKRPRAVRALALRIFARFRESENTPETAQTVKIERVSRLPVFQKIA